MFKNFRLELNGVSAWLFIIGCGVAGGLLGRLIKFVLVYISTIRKG